MLPPMLRRVHFPLKRNLGYHVHCSYQITVDTAHWFWLAQLNCIESVRLRLLLNWKFDFFRKYILQMLIWILALSILAMPSMGLRCYTCSYKVSENGLFLTLKSENLAKTESLKNLQAPSLSLLSLCHHNHHENHHKHHHTPGYHLNSSWRTLQRPWDGRCYSYLQWYQASTRLQTSSLSLIVAHTRSQKTLLAP